MFFCIIFFIFLSLVIFNLYFQDKIYPGIYIAGQEVSGHTQEQTINLLALKFKQPDKIILTNQNQTYEIPLEAIDFSYDFQETAHLAFSLYRTGNIPNDYYHRLFSFSNKINLKLTINLNEEKFEEILSVIAGQIAVEPIYPSIEYVNDEVVVNKGKAGTDIDLKLLHLLIDQSLSYANPRPIQIPILNLDPSLTESKALDFKKRGEKYINKSLQLEADNQIYDYTATQIFNLINPDTSFKENEITELINELSNKIDREPKNPIFIYENGKVTEFSPSLDGLKVDQTQLKDFIIKNLEKLEDSDDISILITIPLNKTAPEYTTEEVNNLGIKELLGMGTSRFKGSIATRIHNISLASSKFNGILIPPNQTFSFNDSLGDVSQYTGYKQAYIIKDGKTILGDGGGVCQVSTTLFRAVLDAGLPVVERRAHAYRVSYYEQDSLPGLDATVYAPTTDLKFKNNSPAHILIQTKFDAKTSTLTFEIYGTSDGRVPTTSKPVVTDVVPPPEDLYVDDPTLPAGEIKQIDWKAWGAKVVFNYVVERDGVTIFEKTFLSNFKPWQAVFLKGTGPVI
ncbi:hypothetical protein A2Z22_03005 [Candidatus Woesebacteria bacterium RBG_16_34_12]|uniref:YoaR-like putative peptidoglycan binding domain-containing protein n=1 Tax=Candidatus Woesebacteria bacterium RBG_16_34_12 TaxID=1802480 RepID=A0A1F7X7V7_9BACT|nr:MAG: hypothetical protein A2Z22_03005 [Candidatus Woesebacteria bacterium RBG_16_34_12]